jgi:N-acetylglucosaminylphosphatidylinositol deacetylase
MHLLCLSNGNFDGLGKIREKELLKAAKYLNFSEVDILNSEKLQDGMSIIWDIDEIKDKV